MWILSRLLSWLTKPRRDWYVSHIRCEVCTNKWIGIYPCKTDEERLECPSCGAYDSHVMQRFGPNDDHKKLSDFGEDGYVQYTTNVDVIQATVSEKN